MRKPVDPLLERLWIFLRREMKPREFEAWICENPSLERWLGADLYFAALSADYRPGDSFDQVEHRLHEFARARSPFACVCIELGDLAVVGMFEASDLALRALEHVKRRGDPRWWLSLRRCTACDQAWLVAQDDRDHDRYCLRRLSDAAATAIVDEDRWPPDFDTFDAVLRVGTNTGARSWWP